MKNGLILTGACGFIGINILLKINPDFRAKYDRIISIDKLGYATTFNRELYKELCEGLKIERIDTNILDLSGHIKFSTNYDWDIIDLASSSHVDVSIANPFSLYEENSIIPSRLLAAFNDLNSIRSYYHISTDEVYGDLPIDVDEKDWFSTNSPFNPSNPYSASKVAQDAYLMAMRRTFNLPVRFIRMANQFGNFQHPEKMLPSSCLRAYNGESIRIYGTGTNMRQWTPVDITAKIIIDKVTQQANFDVLHIANKKGLVTNNYIVDALTEAIGLYTGTTPQIEYVADRLGHDLCYALKTTKEVDDYFKDVNLCHSLISAAEFYYMKHNELQ
jgi:dTDP-glucose 4,6-dehydratase